MTALQAVRDDGRLKPGQSVVVVGAVGGVGHYGVQIARAMGAERNRRNLLREQPSTGP